VGRAPKIGILDLLTSRPVRSLYARIMVPNNASIMPQVVGVWAEELGCEVHYALYTGEGDPRLALPPDLDVLFVSSFTSAASIAYWVSRSFRERGVVTVLGGPHARAYPEDAARHFDYVVGLADRALIRDLLQGFARQADGVQLSAARQPDSLPGVRERWRFVQAVLARAKLFAGVAMLGSVGCPYTCAFCTDSRIDYRALSYDQIREDLAFLRRQLRKPVVAWHDPNFAVRFDDYMDLLESAGPPGSVRFVCESSLSILTEARLDRLARSGCIGVIVGVETWYDFSRKARQGASRGSDKMQAVADHVAAITRRVPYVQSNFVLGLDQDAGDEPFALTREFLDRVPATYPAFSLFTAFGRSAPLGEELRAKGRVIDVPFVFQDCASLHNVRLENYDPAGFYARVGDLLLDAYAPRRTWARVSSALGALRSPGRLATAIRSASSRPRARYYRMLGERMRWDRALGDFLSGAAADGATPDFLRTRARADLGELGGLLPESLALSA
jgi:hypothetical protein